MQELGESPLAKAAPTDLAPDTADDPVIPRRNRRRAARSPAIPRAPIANRPLEV